MYRFTYKRRLHWSECDPARIIFFPNYARWMVEGVDELLLHLNINIYQEHQPGIHGGLPAVKLNMEFHAAPALHDMVTHEIHVSRMGKSSIDFQHRFLRGQQLLMQAQETRVWAQHSPNKDQPIKSIEIPTEIRAALSVKADS